VETVAGSCCSKPPTTIIKVADFEAGIVGLENAFRNVCVSGIHKEEEIANALLKSVKDSGNYISPSRESDYRKALLREYRVHVTNLERDTPTQHKRQSVG
jgi:hypothetical protein